MNINSIKKYEGAVWAIFFLVLMFSEVFVIWEHPDYSIETASEKAINYDVLKTEIVEHGAFMPRLPGRTDFVPMK